jgi:transposase
MNEIWGHDRHKIRDPERRWLRRTYQEGPGFRFLATRGGRPSQSRQRSSEFALVRRRARVVRIAHDRGIAEALALRACSRTSLWRWMGAYQRGGLAALVPGLGGPRLPLRTHPRWVEQVVIAVRLHTYWNAKRISAELRRREIADVGHTWIEQLFSELGTSRPSGPRERGPRYERGSPNSLWHIDIKGTFFIQLAPHRYLKDLVRRSGRRSLTLRARPADLTAPFAGHSWMAVGNMLEAANPLTFARRA